MSNSDALTRFLDQFQAIAPAIVDSYFVVDAERRIVDFNRAFYSMVPKPAARALEGKHCYDVLDLDICRDQCIARQCWREKSHVRLDDIKGRVAGADDDERHFVLSSIPIFDDDGEPVGALEIQRDVTNEAIVQGKYKRMLENEARERERLAAQIRARTRELLESNQRLLETQKELLAYKKGLER